MESSCKKKKKKRIDCFRITCFNKINDKYSGHIYTRLIIFSMRERI